MIFIETTVNRAYLILPECFEDQRGCSNWAFCATEFAETSLQTNFAQANLSGSAGAFTLPCNGGIRWNDLQFNIDLAVKDESGTDGQTFNI